MRWFCGYMKNISPKKTTTMFKKKKKTITTVAFVVKKERGPQLAHSTHEDKK
jgi:hypothetical protein